MSGPSVTPADWLALAGAARDRGRQQADHVSPTAAAQVRAATQGRIEQARAEGLLDPAARDYLAAQHSFAAAHDPHGLAELEGIAEGFGIVAETLFAHQHLGMLRDVARGATIDRDGCSAWATGDGPDGPLVVKNRDFSGTHQGIQRLMWHTGPDIATGGVMCLGSLGSPGAYSSGMNAAGLALADTQIGARHHRVGWPRYFLMTRLLARCATVAEALDFLRAVPHAGGGALILADTTGATAAVELGADHVEIESGALSLRTNHFVSAALAAQTLSATGQIDESSAARYAYLATTLPEARRDIAGAARLMATHADPDGGGAPVCQHAREGDETHTLSSVIYSIREACVYFHPGNPCAGRWQNVRLPV
ncbi:hypothetical protein C2I36_04345 [Rhodobacteraceae bacterium WD3A24]|nr:hypothetical protein C2I36_04345 [Rhodobacteraceae bacterium WD3A24]